MLPYLLTLAVAPRTVVAIDPGHPSESGRGTHGRKFSEIHVAWRIASLLRDRLRRDGYTIVMTKRQENEFVRNRRRAEIANTAGARLMVRLHCDASAGTGFAVYHPTRSGKAPDGGVGPSSAVLTACARVAKPFHSAVAAALRGELRDNGLQSDLRTAIGGRQGALTGSIYSRVPVVLVEMVVLTNRKDEDFIGSSEGERKVADALAAGVRAATPLLKPRAGRR